MAKAFTHIQAIRAVDTEEFPELKASLYLGLDVNHDLQIFVSQNRRAGHPPVVPLINGGSYSERMPGAIFAIQWSPLTAFGDILLWGSMLDQLNHVAAWNSRGVETTIGKMFSADIWTSHRSIENLKTMNFTQFQHAAMEEVEMYCEIILNTITPQSSVCLEF